MFRRRRTKIRKKTKYTILDNMDEQERMELRPKYSEKSLLSLAVCHMGVLLRESFHEIRWSVS